MSEQQKLMVEIAARLMAAHVEKFGVSRDQAYAVRCVAAAKTIVEGKLK